MRGRVAPLHDGEGLGPGGGRRKRSTRRRQDAPDLPRKKVERRTLGKVYTAPDGTEHRPSMWLSLTLDSYGRVLPDGTPVGPDTYDYRRAAWDAVHFARLLDRFWQNLRRCVGWNVQYAGCVEPQRRLAPHAHFASRGTIPRAVLRQVAAATYHQVGWPPADEPVYTLDRPPVFDGDTGEWVDPDTHEPLPSWRDALDLVDSDPTAEPAHVVRFGRQVHAEGVTPGTVHAQRTIGYITKYITKSPADCHKTTNDRQRDHLDRLWHQLRITPCNDRCANWLLYGIQPKKAHGRLQAGRCKGKGPPAGHPRHRWAPHPRLPRLVGKDPRRRPRLGPQPPRRHHGRRRLRPRRTRRPSRLRLGTRPPRRPRHPTPATPAPASAIPTRPMESRPTRRERPGGNHRHDHRPPR